MYDEPSSDEVLIFLMSLFITLPFWFRWYFTVLSIRTITPIPQRQWLCWLPIACLGSVLLVLTQLADPQVRSSQFYLALFLAIAALVLQLINSVASLLGIGTIAHGIERRNRAAIWAMGGAWIGATACIDGSNIGEGPTIYTTIESLVLSIGAFIVLWVLYAVLTRNPVAIAVERDQAAGLRLAGLLIALGTILGRAVAGTWVSTSATFADLIRQAWITLPLLAVAIIVEWRLRPNKRQPFPAIGTAGWYPAVSYGAIALLWVFFLGGWR